MCMSNGLMSWQYQNHYEQTDVSNLQFQIPVRAIKLGQQGFTTNIIIMIKICDL